LGGAGGNSFSASSDSGGGAAAGDPGADSSQSVGAENPDTGADGPGSSAGDGLGPDLAPIDSAGGGFLVDDGRAGAHKRSRRGADEQDADGAA
jgi:hypothetical protein